MHLGGPPTQFLQGNYCSLWLYAGETRKLLGGTVVPQKHLLNQQENKNKTTVTKQPVTILYLLYKDGQQHTHRVLSSLEKERKKSYPG